MADVKDVPFYIPISRSRVKDALIAMDVVDETLAKELKQVSQMLEALWHHNSHTTQEKLKSIYEHVDPFEHPHGALPRVEQFLNIFDGVLKDGNWEPITNEELQEAMEGEDVFPISLDVRLDEFLEMRLYKLGVMPFTTFRKAFFGLKKIPIEGMAYDRVLQVVQYKEEEWFKANKRMKNFPGKDARGLHMHLFKTVPKLDLETIFPNTTPNMRGIDRLKILAPALAGVVTIAAKFGPILFGDTPGDTNLSLVFGALVGLFTYMLRSYLAFRKTKESYLAQVSKDLYFKGQANNSAVINLVTDLSEEQEVKEAILAYFFLLVEADHGHTIESLDDRVEKWISDTFGIKVDFEVQDALGKLRELGLLEETNGLMSVVPPKKALKILDRIWDEIYNFKD